MVFHVTGFGKFAGVASNPTSVMVPRLAEYARLNLNMHRPPLNAMVISDTTVLVVSTVAVDAHLAALEAELAARCGADDDVHVLLHFGVAASRGLFSLEVAAYNTADFGVPDEAGLVLTGAPITADEAMGVPRRCVLPLQWLATRLCDRHLEAEVSDDPGRYICNWTYFRSCQTTARLNAVARSGGGSGGGAAAVAAAASAAAAVPDDVRARRFHSLFVHVPLFAVASLDEQLSMAATLMADITLALVAPPAGAWDGPAGAATVAAAALARGADATAAATAAAAAGGVTDAAAEAAGASPPPSAADSELGMTVISMLLSLGASAGAARRAVEMVAAAGMLTDEESAADAAAVLALDMDGEDAGDDDDDDDSPAPAAAAAGGSGGAAPAAPAPTPAPASTPAPAPAPAPASRDAAAAASRGSPSAATGGAPRGGGGLRGTGSPAAATAAASTPPAAGGSRGSPGAAAAVRGAGGRGSPRAGSGSDEYKMVIVVRSDLGMSTGKVAAQACHAALAAVRRLNGSRAGAVRTWESQGEPVIVLKGDGGMEQLRALEGEARARGVPAASIRDAGRTEVAPGTTTVLAVGPAPKGEVDAITGHLKLL